MKIVALENFGLSLDQISYLSAGFESLGHTFSFFENRSEEEDTIIERATDAEILIVSTIRISEKVIHSCPKLKMIAVAFTGCDHIPLALCREKGILVSNAAGYSTRAVAELAIGMMIDLLRRITMFNTETRQAMGRGIFLGRELSGKTVGIIGTGAIGMNVARILKAFGCEVVAYSRSKKSEAGELGIQYLKLNEVLAVSDIITIHTPLTPQTQNLIGERELGLMKSTAILINTARGGVVNQAALVKALNEKKIAGAALDVFDKEPPLPVDHPLLFTPNTVVVPHIGYATQEAIK
ncbi:MAG: NAD(P)-dependent oxidoreductase, partial [Bacteroidota bacterium]|nr:NAD(P)-dependent oxidoreductase [Bacteroidota bacterium]